MVLSPEAVQVPLERTENGDWCVTGTRVSLDLLMADYKSGKSAELIASSYPTLKLADVYGVLAFYHSHKAEVETYLAEQTQVRQELHARIERDFPQEGLAAKIKSRYEAKPNQNQ
jgi:uncharacterized protein (DUF433 family)